MYYFFQVVANCGLQYLQENTLKIYNDTAVSTLSRGQAQMKFLREVSLPPAPHNMAIYQLRAGKTASAPNVHIGLNTSGITIFLQEGGSEDKCSVIAQLSWPSIVKLSFEVNN